MLAPPPKILLLLCVTWAQTIANAIFLPPFTVAVAAYSVPNPEPTFWRRPSPHENFNATLPWQGLSGAAPHPCVCEPQVMWTPAPKQIKTNLAKTNENHTMENTIVEAFDGEYRMYYRGGWGGSALGVVFADDPLAIAEGREQWRYTSRFFEPGNSSVSRRNASLPLQAAGINGNKPAPPGPIKAQQPWVLYQTVEQGAPDAEHGTFWLFASRGPATALFQSPGNDGVVNWSVASYVNSSDGYLPNWNNVVPYPSWPKTNPNRTCTWQGNRAIWIEEFEEGEVTNGTGVSGGKTMKTFQAHLLQEMSCDGPWLTYHYVSDRWTVPAVRPVPTAPTAGAVPGARAPPLSNWSLAPDSRDPKKHNEPISLQELARAPGGCVSGPSVATLPQFAGAGPNGNNNAVRNAMPVPHPRNSTGHYHLWFHATPQTGVLPTDIYHAVKQPSGGGGGFGGGKWELLHANASDNSLGAELEHEGAYPKKYGQDAWEFDQVADPSVVYYMQDFLGPTRRRTAAAGRRALMFYDGDNNIREECSIGMVVGSASEVFPGGPGQGDAGHGKMKNDG